MTIREVTDAEIQKLTTSGIWRTENLFQVLDENAARHGERLAVADAHRRLTYREFAEQTQLLAGWLSGLRLARGSVVAVQTRSSTLIPLMHFACDRADLTFLPLSDAWRSREVGHLLRQSRARVFIVPPDTKDFSYAEMISELRGDLPELEVVASAEEGSTGISVEEIVSRSSQFRGSPLASPNEPRMCMVTSGTSGLPKISLYTDNNLWYFLSTYVRTLESTGTEVFANLAPANTGSTGYLFPVLTPLLFGSTCVMLEHWNPITALELLEREKVNVAVAVPTQVIKLLDVARDRQVDLSPLRAITTAGAPLPPEVAEEAERALGCRILPMYGATDGGVPAFTTVSDPAEKRYSTVGKIIPHTQFRIATADGSVAEGGSAGEVQWRNPIKTLGYLNDDSQTQAAFTPDGLYRSGDLGKLDDEGYLRIVGRAKDLIIRGGQNVSPREIEDIVVGMEEVVEAAVLGLSDPVYGERVCLCVVPKGPGLTLERVAAYLQERGLPKFMIPEHFMEFSEFPLNSGGKVSKGDLRTLVLERTR
ncbi:MULTISPECIES: class I adenylate-forming enzyme family protein [unclassified Streptomyces]|uniref:class I adenylate-forming enzyme family protein n=1 Tax=unclassified Streptomyces TaxID=2593676 RepID=UPI00110F7EDE|nr:class I adenylate-forming enzyme family protein [Streptomyces sp. DASNCL29]TMU98144.1 acyl--CoA ligase [Streptomyces sp. DASNCL29]